MSTPTVEAPMGGFDEEWAALEASPEWNEPEPRGTPWSTSDYDKWANTADTTGQGGLAAILPPAPRRRSLRGRLYTLDEAASIPAPRALLRDILDRNTVVILAGKFGTYKTFVSIAWACSIATGTPWEGHDAPEAGPVIYIAAEGVSGIRQRVLAWSRGTGVKVPSDKFLILNGRAKLNDSEDVQELLAIIDEVKPLLVVVDTLHQCSPGADEDGSKDAGTVLAACFDMRDRGVTVLLDHHTGHSGRRSRGSSSWEDDIDASWVIDLADEEDRSAKIQRTLKHRKVKDGRLSDDIPIVLEEVTLDITDEDGWPVKAAYIKAGEVPGDTLPGSVGVAEIIKRLDDLGLPADAGRGCCIKSLKANHGTAGDTNLVAEAIRQRKARKP